MYNRPKKHTIPPYDKTGKVLVIRSSICTREQVAGFKAPSSGKFDELMLIRNSNDLIEFLSLYQVIERDIQREW